MGCRPRGGRKQKSKMSDQDEEREPGRSKSAVELIEYIAELTPIELMEVRALVSMRLELQSRIESRNVRVMQLRKENRQLEEALQFVSKQNEELVQRNFHLEPEIKRLDALENVIEFGRQLSEILREKLAAK